MYMVNNFCFASMGLEMSSDDLINLRDLMLSSDK